MNQVSIGSDNGLSPIRRQAIIWPSAVLLSFGPLGTSISEIIIKIWNFPSTKMHLKISPSKWRPFCLGLNELTGLHCLWRTSPQMDLLLSWYTSDSQAKWPVYQRNSSEFHRTKQESLSSSDNIKHPSGGSHVQSSWPWIQMHQINNITKSGLKFNNTIQNDIYCFSPCMKYLLDFSL